MSWYYNSDVSSRKVQCYCGHVFTSRKETCQCSTCKIRFLGNDRPYKTVEDRQKDRKVITDLLVEFRRKQNEMMVEFRKKFDENEKKIIEIENMLKPY